MLCMYLQVSELGCIRLCVRVHESLGVYVLWHSKGKGGSPASTSLTAIPHSPHFCPIRPGLLEPFLISDPWACPLCPAFLRPLLQGPAKGEKNQALGLRPLWGEGVGSWENSGFV